MPPLVLDLASADDARDIVHRAVQALAEGNLVAFPTETVYGIAASALDASAVERLISVKRRAAGHPLPLAIRSMDEAFDYVPHISELGRRLARRCWPGPVTLVCDASDPDSLVQRLPAATRQAVMPNGTVGLRVPAHQAILDVLQMLAGPLVLSSANRSGGEDAVTAAEVLEDLGDDIQLVIDHGRCRFGQPSTVVRVDGGKLAVLRAGVVSEQALKRLASMVVTFVCTGNTCRSPMAETIFRKLAANKLQCKPDELEDKGLVISSAGISAMPGGRAAEEAVSVMAERNLDLSAHQTQGVTEQLLRNSDLVLAMTAGHRDVIVRQWPEFAERVRLLRVDKGDISDPIGGTKEDYRHCADQIERELTEWLDAVDLGQAG